MLTTDDKSGIVEITEAEENLMYKGEYFKLGVVVKSDSEWQSFLTNRNIDFNSYNSTARGYFNGHPTRLYRLIMQVREDTSKYGLDAIIYNYLPPLSLEDQEAEIEDSDDTSDSDE